MRASDEPVIVLGGGFAGLKAAILVRLLSNRTIPVTLIADSNLFQLKPRFILTPFGQQPRVTEVSLARFADYAEMTVLEERVLQVLPDQQRVDTEQNQYHYSHLVIATGAAWDDRSIPGLRSSAIGLWPAA